MTAPKHYQFRYFNHKYHIIHGEGQGLDWGEIAVCGDLIRYRDFGGTESYIQADGRKVCLACKQQVKRRML